MAKGILPKQHLTTMQKLVEMVPANPTYMFGGMFPEEKWDSDKIWWEISYDSGGMTPFVAPGTPAPTIGDDTIGEKTAQAAFWKEKAYLDEEVLNNLRTPGTYQTKMSAERQLAKKTAKLTSRCQARYEWMCAKAITTGAISYQNTKGVKFSVNYNIPAVNKVTLSGNYVWGTGSTRDPVGDFYNAKLALSDTFGVVPTRCIMNSNTMKLLMMDASKVQALLAKSQFGEGNLFANPQLVIGTLMGVGALTTYDAMYEVPVTLTTNVTATATSINVADASDIEVGGIMRFYNSTLENTWEDKVISAVNKITNVVTVAAVTGSYVMGRDYVCVKKRFVPDNLVILMADSVDGMPIGNFALSPHGLGGHYGMYFTDWSDEDPEGVYIRVQNKGLPMLYHPEAIYLLTVA